MSILATWSFRGLSVFCVAFFTLWYLDAFNILNSIARNTILLDPTARSPGYDGPPPVPCSAFSPLESSLDEALLRLESIHTNRDKNSWTRKIWQMHSNLNRVASKKSCLSKSPDWRYEIFNDEQAQVWVEQVFGDIPEIVDVYTRLPRPVCKSDLLRYLLLWFEGGLWTDTDAICLQPIDDWLTSSQWSDPSLKAITAIETDRPYWYEPNWRWLSWTSPEDNYGFTTWTILSKPFSPTFRRTLVLSVSATLELLNSEVQDFTDAQILTTTGPTLFTVAVLQTMACEDDSCHPVGWLNVTNIAESKAIGSTLILPASSFNARKERGPGRFIQHLGDHSWRTGWIT